MASGSPLSLEVASFKVVDYSYVGSRMLCSTSSTAVALDTNIGKINNDPSYNGVIHNFNRRLSLDRGNFSFIAAMTPSTSYLAFFFF